MLLFWAPQEMQVIHSQSLAFLDFSQWQCSVSPLHRSPNLTNFILEPLLAYMNANISNRTV